jgi:4-diphosphocytidyl-2-C-methyl-D-erythritol kinase
VVFVKNLHNLPSPAKLNLMLHITGQRDDGYHELQTLFQFVDYGDTLSFDHAKNNEITLTPSIEGVDDNDNLIIKAAKRLQAFAHCNQGAQITLNKVLPMGGGLGGGSSNAATTLIALNILWDLNLPLTTLAEIGLALGADVPVFVMGTSAFAEGIGEQLTPVDLPEPWYLIIKPDAHSDTKEIFSHKLLTRDSPKSKMRSVLTRQRRNDCEAVVRMIYPEIDKSLNLLNKFSSARMTGTGACIFSEHNSEDDAKAILVKLPAETNAFIAKGSNKSPLHTVLSAQ